MHTTVHYASGLILASIAHAFLGLNFWVFGCIVASPILPDVDIFFSRYAKDQNHRTLFTHSLYLGLAAVLIGLLSQRVWIVIIGMGYLTHLSFDLIDWGTNLFYTGKMYGCHRLLTRHEKADVNFYDVNNKQDPWFFFDRYYGSPITLTFEIVTPVLGITLLFLYAPLFWYFLFGYIAVFIFHLTLYIEVQRLKRGEKIRIGLFKPILHQ
jgi:hypothetical protein